MHTIYLDGYGIKINTKNLRRRSELAITDGRDKYTSKQEILKFSPRKFPFDVILIEGYSGYISLQALHWLSKNNIPVFIIDFDGTILSSILPPTPIKVDVKLAQIKSASDKNTRFNIAHALFCSYVVQIYNLDFQCIMLFYNSPFKNDMPQNAPDPSFKAILQNEGYSERVIKELWKWYDYKEKKGVASF